MKAVRIHSHGGPEVLRIDEIAEPTPGPGEVLVRMRAASVNHLDLWVRRGMPGHPVPFPRILGCDGAGEVAALGAGVAGLALGTRVLVAPGVSSGVSREALAGREQLAPDYRLLGEDCDGVDAELVAVPQANAIPIPASVSYRDAAAIPLVFCTAWGMLVEKAQLRAGEDVLVLGAGSGVGSAAVQLAKLLGARVFTTVGGAAKVAKAIALGADLVIDHEAQDFAAEVKRATGGRGVDLVVEHVGQATFARSLKSLAKGGRIVTCGATTGPKIELNLLHLFIKHQAILGSTMGPKSCLFQALRWMEQGRFRAVVDRVLPIDDIAEAHRVVERREHFGKVVLEL
ncbi:MAG: zinc-binding dehydrogenase [Planctomycetes bacterium]|nr:zinc-binding dehydrogenase [Planctomycetota bacterium]